MSPEPIEHLPSDVAIRTMCALAVLAAVFGAGCGTGGDAASDKPFGSGLEIDLDKKGERELLSYYMGGYVPGEAADPFEAELLVEWNGNVFIPDSVLQVELGRHIRGLEAVAGDDRLVDWDEFESFILDTWPSVRDAPATVGEARTRYGDWSDEAAWFTMEVTGSMSPYRRRIAIEHSALRAAIDGLSSLEDAVIYPIGSVFVGEHVTAGQAQGDVVETTFMVKRPDGLWDYFAYGSDGRWTTTIENEPSDLNVPTQCVGCHVGSRPFEPERSFPAAARPGPSGPRLVHVDPDIRTEGIVGRLREHVRRSDTILGLYATLYLSRIRSARPDSLNEWEQSTRARLLTE